jgi:hypothetical protein
VAALSAPASSSRRAHGVAREPQRALDGLALRRSCSSAASAWRLSGRRREARLALDVEGAIEVVLRALGA